MSDNKLNKIMADLIYEANMVSAARVVLRTLNDSFNRINEMNLVRVIMTGAKNDSSAFI